LAGETSHQSHKDRFRERKNYPSLIKLAVAKKGKGGSPRYITKAINNKGGFSLNQEGGWKREKEIKRGSGIKGQKNFRGKLVETIKRH